MEESRQLVRPREYGKLHEHPLGANCLDNSSVSQAGVLHLGGAMDLKRCNVCGLEKTLDQFYVSRPQSGKPYIIPRCKPCECIRARGWQSRNKERVAATSRAYIRANAAKNREWSAQWKRANPEKAKEVDRKSRLKNIERIRACDRAYKDAHKQERYQYNAKWYRLNLTRARENCRLSSQRRRARLLSVPHDLTRAEWDAIKAAYRGRCAYCGKKAKRLTMDHITPISKGGHHTSDNVIPACRHCNCTKATGPAPSHQKVLVGLLS